MLKEDADVEDTRRTLESSGQHFKSQNTTAEAIENIAKVVDNTVDVTDNNVEVMDYSLEVTNNNLESVLMILITLRWS